MIDEHAKATLHDHLRWVREALVWSSYVPWWDEEVPLFNVMVHRLSDATRHAGHADILRERLDGAVGIDADSAPLHGRDRAFWEARCGELERRASAAAPD